MANKKTECIHEDECEDYPDKCSKCKHNKKKTFFEPIIPKRIQVCPELMNPMQQYKFIWGQKPKYSKICSICGGSGSAVGAGCPSCGVFDAETHSKWISD